MFHVNEYTGASMFRLPSEMSLGGLQLEPDLYISNIILW